MAKHTIRSTIVAGPVAAMLVAVRGMAAQPAPTATTEPRNAPQGTPPDATQGTKGNVGPGSAEWSGYFGGTDATTYGESPEVAPPPRSEEEPMSPVR